MSWQSPRQPARRRGPGALIAAIALLITFAALGALVTTQWTPLIREDHASELAVHTIVLRHLALRTAALAASTAGSPFSVDLITLAVVVGLLITRRVRATIYLVAARVLELAIETVTKYLLARPRPMLSHPVAHAGGFSFPSGHTGGTAVLCVSLLALALPVLRTGLRLLLVVLAACATFAVAASRVLLGVHYPSDVAGGALVGTAAALGLVTTLLTTRQSTTGTATPTQRPDLTRRPPHPPHPPDSATPGAPVPGSR